MKQIFTIFITLFGSLSLFAQAPYFVDGYHGGIYGHYPVEWKTGFMADKLAEHPEWRICLEIEPETWDTVRMRTPSDLARLTKFVDQKRVEFVNPTYAQPYCYNISGESLIRHFEYGMRKIHDHFPQAQIQTYSVEEPCFTSSLPQILKSFGFKYASLKCPNTCWGGYMAPYGGQFVNWIGPDGSSILTSPRYANEAFEKKSVWQTTAWGNSKEYLEACRAQGIKQPIGMCLQDAGWKGGPWIGSGEHIRNNSTYILWSDYFERYGKQGSDDNYRLSQEDVRVSLMWGSQVMQRLAREVRDSENMMSMAEKVSAIANLSNGYRYDQCSVDAAWRTLLMAQHHDCWIVPYNGLNKNGNWAQNVTLWTGSTNETVNQIFGQVYSSFADPKADSEDLVRITNSMAISRREVVKVELPKKFFGKQLIITDSSGKRVASTTTSADSPFVLIEATVPAFGYATYRVAIADQNVEVVAGDQNYILENNMYRIEVDPSRGGAIISLVAKAQADKEYVDANNKFMMGEIRGHFYDLGRFCSSVEKSAKVTKIANSSLEQTLLIEGHIESHPFSQTITIRKGEPRIDFDLKIDWQGNPRIGEYEQKDAFAANRRAFYDDRYKLNVLFPNTLTTPELHKDAPFDVCRSENKNTWFNTWDSIKHNIILHWVDLSEPTKRGSGLALLSDHTTSYSYGEDFPLALTTQYSGGGLWGFGYGIKGASKMSYSLLPHCGAWDKADVQNHSLRYNEPLLGVYMQSAKCEDLSLLNLEGTGYELSAAYLTDKGVVVRLYNASGSDKTQSIDFGFAISKIIETDMRGNELHDYKFARRGSKSTLKVQMPRFGIKTFHITR